MTQPVDAIWAALIGEELFRLGVSHICIAPGSRSTALTLAMSAHKFLHVYTHIDERGLGFFALGLAKSTQQPVAIITTSGTAVSNLLPAVIEAKQAEIPLLVLSADRPPELQQNGSNQTIAQRHLFGSYAAYYELPVPTVDILASYVLATLDESVHRSIASCGPVHLNCMFRHPFSGAVSLESLTKHPYIAEIKTWLSGKCTWVTFFDAKKLSHDMLEPVFAKASEWKKACLLVHETTAEEAEAIFALAVKLNCAVVAEANSPLCFISHPLVYSACAIKDAMDGADGVIQFGKHAVTTPVIQEITQFKGMLICVLNTAMPNNPSSKACVITTDIVLFCEALKIMPVAWANRPSLKTLPFNQSLEAEVVRSIMANLPDSVGIFCGNSLPIRTFSMVNSAKRIKISSVYSNRGASGIDGCIATGIGCFVGANLPGVLVVGDISALHDINSLLLLNQATVPIHVIIINNFGGQIFDQLPISATKDVVNTYFKMPQRVDFSSLAKGFGCKYVCIDAGNPFEEELSQNISFEASSIIEIVVR